MTLVYETAERIGAIEAQIWVYERLSRVRSGNEPL